MIARIFLFIISFLATPTFARELVPAKLSECESYLTDPIIRDAQFAKDGIEILSNFERLDDDTITFMTKLANRPVSKTDFNFDLIPDLSTDSPDFERLRKYIETLRHEIEARIPNEGPLALEKAEIRRTIGSDEKPDDFLIAFHQDFTWITTTVAFDGISTPLISHDGRVVSGPLHAPVVLSGLERLDAKKGPAIWHGQPESFEHNRLLLVLRFAPEFPGQMQSSLWRLKIGMRVADLQYVFPQLSKPKIMSASRHNEYAVLYDENHEEKCYRFHFFEGHLQYWKTEPKEACAD